MLASFWRQLEKNVQIYAKCFIAFNFLWYHVVLIIFSTEDSQCIEISKKYNVTSN